MPSNFPGQIDNFTRQTGTGTAANDNGLTHKEYHDNAFDGIEAIESELGTNPAGSDATVAARFTRIQKLYDYSTSTRSKTSTTTLNSTSAFAVTVSANVPYRWGFHAHVQSANSSGTAGDIKFGFSVPGTPTFFSAQAWGSAEPASYAGYEGDVHIQGANNAGGVFVLGVVGAFISSGNAVQLMGALQTPTGGSFELRWAQNSSNANATSIMAGAVLWAERMD